MTTAANLAQASVPTPYIVVVDDEEDLREPVAAYLRDQGIDVDEAGGGAALDVLLADRAPALVVLDVTMPDEDGFTVLSQLRAVSCPLPVIILTARSGLTDTVRGLEGGANDYMPKPFRFQELLARIRLRLTPPRSSPRGRAWSAIVFETEIRTT